MYSGAFNYTSLYMTDEAKVFFVSWKSKNILFLHVLFWKNFLFSRGKLFVFSWKTNCFSLRYTMQTAAIQRLFGMFFRFRTSNNSQKCIVMYSYKAHYTLIKLLYINSLYAKMYRCIVKSKIFFEEINKSNLSFALRSTPVNFWPSVEDTHVLASLW